MNFVILGLDIAKDSAMQLSSHGELYNCEFENYSNLETFKNRVFSNNRLAVVVVDIDEDKNEKFKMCVDFSNHSNLIILFLSTEFNQDERVRWLSYGVSSYVKKPFRVEELFRYATALLKNYQKVLLSDDNFEVDLKQRSIMFRGKGIKSTSKIFNLIVYFMENEGVVISREKLMAEVFGNKNYLTDRNIDTFIKQLRSQTSYDVIKTVRGVGYIYNGKKM